MAVVARFQTRKTVALLACLAFPPNRRRSREELIDLLWPDAEPDAGRHRLSQALVWLRAQFEPPDVPENSIPVAGRQSIGLRPGSVLTDVGRFQAAVIPARQCLPRNSFLRRTEPDPSVEVRPGDHAAGHGLLPYRLSRFLRSDVIMSKDDQ